MQKQLDIIDEQKNNSVLPEASEEMFDNFEKDLYNLITGFYKGE